MQIDCGSDFRRMMHMKKYIKTFLRKKKGKRIVSLLTAFVMIFCALPAAEIGEKIGELDFTSISVNAASDPPSGYRFLHNPVDSNKISLSIKDFYDYAESYKDYAAYHENDEITIKTSTGNTQYYQRNFAGLGTVENPFAGKLTIEVNNPLVLNLDAPLFKYVTDTAVLNGTTGIKIARFYGHDIPSGETVKDNTPLLAENVVKKDGTKATWNVNIVKPSATDDGVSGTLEAFGGMIGTMGAGAQLTLNVTMDQQTGDTDPIELKSISNLGLACGLIKQNATLSFSIGASGSGTIRNISKIGTTSGNVGGLVGEMESGSTFNYTGTNIQEDNTPIETNSGYAGGIVGKINNATLTFSDTTYNIKQYISGTKGVGGIYGYYKPRSNENTIDLSKYNIDGQVNNTGKSANIGGLFGEFECDHSFTINTNTTVHSKHASGEAASYGGLIGKYTNTSLSNTLTIGAVTTETKNESGKGVSYGGAIGIADATNANYIKFDGFKVDKAYNANALTFGGLIASAGNTFLDANNVTIKVSGVFHGGGLVGDLGNGSLRMTGTTDLSNAKSVSPTSDAYKYGQIVGIRDSALVFAENGWVLKRSEAVEADDIGAWGEVIRFDSKDTGTETDEEITYDLTYEQFDNNTVLTANETTHTISIADSPDSISNTADFAATALNIQISSGDIVTSGSTSDAISLEDDIVLSGTGLTGFTRDNNKDNSLTEPHCVFSGSFNASGHTVTLAIGEPYGYRGETNLSTAATRSDGDGRIYNHRYNGLFGILQGSDDTSFGSTDDSTITINGKCSVSPKANSVYVGSVAGVATNKVNIYSVNVSTTFDYGGSKDVYLGGLVGEINSPTAIEDEETPEVEIANCEFSGVVSGTNNSTETCIGGVVGKIYHTANEQQYWNLQNLTVSGTVENKATKTQQRIGGLIAKIEGYSATSGFNSRKLVLNNITTSNLEIKGGAATSMGGLLGYQWLNTDVFIGVVDEDSGEVDEDTKVTIDSGSKVTASGAVKDMAGLVYNATGKWTVNKLNIDGIEIAANNPRSFGMIINKGWYSSNTNYKTNDNSSAIYLLLMATDCYTISDSTLTTLSEAAVFDELVAYSAYYRDDGDNRYATDASGDEYILKNGNGVVSIHIATVSEDDGETLELGLVMDGGDNASNSYKAQTSLGAKPNPWTRYYYDLDVITNTEYDFYSSPAGKLMLWGLNKYAHQSIKSNFTDQFTSNSFINGETYDMTGYSWYPVDVEFNVTVKGIFKFANKEFELSEAENAGSYNSQKSSISTEYNDADYKTQHYLMHCGLFRNVYSGKTVTLSSTPKFRGNVAKADKYCGVLICGTVDGSSDTNKATITINNLELQGAYIHNIENLTGASVTYAPLLINKITKYTNLTVKNVKTSTTTNYRYIDDSCIPYINRDDDNFPKAGSSLIGEVGSSTAKGLNLVFETIQLDGRTADLATGNDTLNTKYRTNRTIFTKATLLDKFEFESGSKGKYTYTWTDDWGSNSQKKVTYGKEVGYKTEGEYPNIERIYMGEPNDATARYTNPTNNADTTGDYDSTFKSSFLPYVYTPYTDANGTTHQLEVNHRTTQAEGCGTYNDPYIIKSGSDLESIAKIINGDLTADTTKITLPTDSERATYWCNDKVGKTNHNEYTYDGSNFICTGQTSLSAETVRTYLAGAYYKLGDNIDLDNTYPGISTFSAINTSGTDKNNFAVFRGVIDGGGYTIKNKSSLPLVVNSYGCVIKNLTVNVQNSADISLIQDSITAFPTCTSYGGLIANILGGDNILDGVSVDYSGMTKKIGVNTGTSSKYYQLIPIGGYIGVVVDGAVVFKNMSSSTQGLSTVPSGKFSNISLDNQKYLYVNPIIGRVINGYAVTESSSYKTAENDVTMHNGKKNYSIADITKDNNIAMLSTGAYTSIGTASYSTDVSIPNAQALFVMSLLTQSSTTVGTPGTGALTLGTSDSYDGALKVRRRAAYSEVGTNAANDDKPADYNAAIADTATSGVPYIVANYTGVIENTTNYGVLALTNNNTVCNFSLGGTSTEWTLPDGFRGIGCIGFKRSNLTNRTISLHKLSGLIETEGSGEQEEEESEEDNVITIHLNMSLQHYETSYENYLPVNSGNDDIGCIGGFGLFNTLHHNRKDQGDISGDYKISDLKITGNINYFVFKHDKTDGITTYNSSYVHNNAYLNAGGIAGYAGMLDSDSITVEKIGVSGLTVNGFETAGGFFGNLQLQNEGSSGHQVSISNITAETAFTVTSKRYSGGIIGYFKQGNLNINNVTIKLPKVINEYRGSAYQDFLNGAGGVIGFAQTGSSNSPMVLTDITLGQQNTAITSRIGYKEGDTFYRNSDSAGDDTVVAGGIIGRSYTIGNKTENGIKYSLKLEKCNVYNISLYGHRVGGLIGADIGASGAAKDGISYLAFLNCNVISDQESIIIKGLTDTVNISKLQHRASGGIIGGARAKQIIVDTCTVKGYTFWGYNDTAGVCGNLEEAPIYIRNFTISDVVFKSNYAASLVGWLNMSLQGYNILCDNVQFQDKDGGTTYNSAQHGYLVAKNNVKSIKIAGLSIQNATPKSTSYFIPPRLSGTNDYNINGGYVIFADYNGAASNSNKVFSDINDTANVRNYNNQIVTDNNPYVTSSPKMFIGRDKFLTGDAVSSTDYNNSALKQIILDKQDSQKSQNGAQSYQTAPNVDTDLLKDVTDNLTTSRKEFDSAFPYDFPMLKVEDTDKAKITAYINYYLQNLTNTKYTFQNDLSNVYKVTLHKCEYSGGTFTVGAAGTGSLGRTNTGFKMDPTKIDNQDPSKPQFTLMDIQFLDPSANSKVAYHLYVPIYVKKLIQYTFSAKLESGTNYYEDAYADIAAGNTLFDNLGSPVTMRLEYTYDRDAQDWADAINGGENVLTGSNFYKELLLTMNDNGWIPNSRMVLVDANNNDKHYYRDTAVTVADANGDYHIPFESFTTTGTEQGTAYSPAMFNDFLTLSVSDDGGTLITTNSASDATVKVGNQYYKPAPEGSSGKYKVSVSAVKPEVYYLSFFTPKIENNDKIYQYTIKTIERFEQRGTEDTGWKPNKLKGSNNPVHLIVGDLYTNDIVGLSVTPQLPTNKMSKSNSILTVTMTARVGLTPTAQTALIAENLAQNKNSTIYQTFLMNYKSTEHIGEEYPTKIGVDKSAISSILVTDYKIYHGASASGTGVTVPYSDPEELMTSNYIELRNNQNLNEYLSDSTTGHNNMATIQVTFAVEYSEKNLSRQFPERTVETDSDVGAQVFGYSNISSVAQSGAYSAASTNRGDTDATGPVLYYTTNLATASLVYNADKTMQSANGEYSSLGVNPFDDGTKDTNKGHIDSTATYSFVDLQTSDNYIEFNITLTSKIDGYDRTPLDIREYFQNLTIKADKDDTTALYTQGTNNTTGTAVRAYMSADGTKITIRAHKDSFKKVADKVYSLCISYDVLTGDTNGFGDTKAYSNYMVKVTADMYDSIDTTATPDTQPHASDHIIYTNSKLQYQVI